MEKKNPDICAYKQKGTLLKLEYCYRNVSEYLNDASERSPADSQPKCEYTIQILNFLGITIVLGASLLFSYRGERVGGHS